MSARPIHLRIADLQRQGFPEGRIALLVDVELEVVRQVSAKHHAPPLASGNDDQSVVPRRRCRDRLPKLPPRKLGEEPGARAIALVVHAVTGGRACR